MQCSPFPIRRSWTSLLSKDSTCLRAGRSSSRTTSPSGPLPFTSRSASSKQWVSRQTTDRFAREAKVQGLKSRAAFKLLQINDKYRLFKPGMTVVDLGFAPGSWSQVRTHHFISCTSTQTDGLPIQVAIEMTKPSGRVLGVDLLPAQPPKGVSTFQGDFTSPDIQADIISFLRDPDRGRPRRTQVFAEDPIAEDALQEVAQSYIDKERQSSAGDGEVPDLDEHNDKVVDVVLSDMWEPWEPIEGHYKRSLSNPYFRMMNTSGNAFRDHAGSMVCPPPLPAVPPSTSPTTP
jgi:21S rRNA (uridine2791-2'-O)-methyltransferase